MGIDDLDGVFLDGMDGVCHVIWHIKMINTP